MPEVAILDLGGQYCHLISRRLRDLRVKSAIFPPDVAAASLGKYAGIILSGGPRSVYEAGAPLIDRHILDLKVPVLGICYGHQLLAQCLGGTVEAGAGEYGLSNLSLVESDTIFRNTPAQQQVWMSHSDAVADLPPSFLRLARTDRCEIAAFADLERMLFGVQFHPEVTHSENGIDVLRNFCVDVCGITPDKNALARVPFLVEEIREKVGPRSVFFLVSGGVDSSVAFALCAKALPAERILGLYVDTGLMRKGETEELLGNFARLGLSERLRVRDESRRFLDALQSVTEPEAKREIIGRLFVDVQAEAMREYGIDENQWLLGQGTIYPDTIESGGSHGRAAVIKTHHNRCAEITELMRKGLIIEPLAEFYKDEVREIGREVGLDVELTNRWPFPGPGLAIRCLCCERGDEAIAESIRLEAEFDDFEAVRLPLRSVGVQGDGRTYRSVVAVRGPLDYERLQHLSGSLCNVSTAYNRVIFALNGDHVALVRGKTSAAFLSRRRLDLLREADSLVRGIMKDTGLTDSVWQFPVVLIPMSFASGETIVLRPVNSVDGMTANFAHLPIEVVERMAAEIGALEGVDLVCLDVTDKPPATIEWE